MLIIAILLCLTIIPIKLIPMEFSEEPLTWSLTEPLLFVITLLFTVGFILLPTSNTEFPTVILIALTYGQACADLYYKLISPLLLLVQCLVSLLWFHLNFFDLILCVFAYYIFYLLNSFMTHSMIGLGDIKLLFLLFFSLPLIQFYICLLCASSLALLYSFISIEFTHRSLNSLLPFIPFLYFGLSLSFLF